MPAPASVALATAITEEYVRPWLVTFSTLVERLGPGAKPVLYLLHTRLGRESMARIGAIAETREVVPPAELLQTIPPHAAWPREAAFPLLLPRLLPPDVERVLFLDADLLVLDDLAPLWELDLRGHPLAAAIDPAIPRCGAPRGLDDPARANDPYFNAGVMLIDCEAWRRVALAERCLAYLRAHPDAALYHQTALNAVLGGDWLPLESRYNVAAGPAGRPHPAHPAIVHFAGRFKPWRFQTGSPYDAEYARALVRLGFHRRPPGREQLLSYYDLYVRSSLYWLEKRLMGRAWS